MVRRGVRIILGLALVLHGLANAVLPMRGVDAVTPGVWALPLTAAYVIAIVSFVGSGLGVLGVRPLARLLQRGPLIGGLSAIVAQVWLADSDLWVGLVLSVLLPILTALWAKTTRFEATSARLGWRLATDVVGLAFLAWVFASATLWPWHRTWGTTPQEWVLSLPGDHAPRTPALEILHGVTIDAPPSAVWPWLAQLGQDRAGFYSYERLERLFGADVHNVKEIRPEWQSRGAGDKVPATQPGYLGGLFGERPGWTVDLAEPNHALVLRHWGAFVLLPQGHSQTRFLIRSTISGERIPAWAAGLNLIAFELPHFIMQRRMMLNIKGLAERSATNEAQLIGGSF